MASPNGRPSFPVYYWVFAAHAADYTALLDEFVAGEAFLAMAYVTYRSRSFATLMLLAIGQVAHAHPSVGEFPSDR